jgi:hypothetical protein
MIVEEIYFLLPAVVMLLSFVVSLTCTFGNIPEQIKIKLLNKDLNVQECDATEVSFMHCSLVHKKIFL